MITPNLQSYLNLLWEIYSINLFNKLTKFISTRTRVFLFLIDLNDKCRVMLRKKFTGFNIEKIYTFLAATKIEDSKWFLPQTVLF